MSHRFPRILSIAGSDSGGGAGIQADIKTITMLGGYAMTAVTALTAQDSRGVAEIHHSPVDFVIKQIAMVVEDFGVDAVKTGMLGSAEMIDAVADYLVTLPNHLPIVVDPVMIAKGGARLLARDAERRMIERMLPLATVLTPNVPEAEALTGGSIETLDDMREASYSLIAQGARAVVLKGGHLRHTATPGQVADIVTTGSVEQVDGASSIRKHNRCETFFSERLDTTHTHGTGCTLSAALATLLAREPALFDVIVPARRYIFRAMQSAPGYGSGHGPLNHLIDPEKVKELALSGELG